MRSLAPVPALLAGLCLAAVFLLGASPPTAKPKPTPPPVTYVTVTSSPPAPAPTWSVQCPVDHPHATGGGAQAIDLGHALDGTAPANAAGQPIAAGEPATGWYGSSTNSAIRAVYVVCASP